MWFFHSKPTILGNPQFWETSNFGETPNFGKAPILGETPNFGETSNFGKPPILGKPYMSSFDLFWQGWQWPPSRDQCRPAARPRGARPMFGRLTVLSQSPCWFGGLAFLGIWSRNIQKWWLMVFVELYWLAQNGSMEKSNICEPPNKWIEGDEERRHSDAADSLLIVCALHVFPFNIS